MAQAMAESERSHEQYIKQRSFEQSHGGNHHMLERKGGQPAQDQQFFNMDGAAAAHNNDMPIAGLPVDDEPLIHEQFAPGQSGIYG